MFAFKSTITLLSATLFASVAFAAPSQEPETPGSQGPKMVAEAIHNAKVHGLKDAANQPMPETPGHEQAQAVSESIHLKKQHGNINDSADQRMLRDASRL
jgi:tRNA A37 methylthiotransferase MiaB